MLPYRPLQTQLAGKPISSRSAFGWLNDANRMFKDSLLAGFGSLSPLQIYGLFSSCMSDIRFVHLSNASNCFDPSRCVERHAGFKAGWSFWNSGRNTQNFKESSAQLPPSLEVFLRPTRVSDHPAGQRGQSASLWLLQVWNIQPVPLLNVCWVLLSV